MHDAGDMMTRAYKVAASAVKARYAEQKPHFLEALTKLSAANVAIYSGTYDHVQHVFSNLGVKPTMDPDKPKAKIIFANCTATFNPTRLRAVREAVEAGATLVTSDWCLKSVIEAGFKGTVKHNGKSSGDEVVAVEPFGDSVWNEIAVPGVDPQWWLESSSYPIEILNREIVNIEAASHDMLVKFDAPEVAISFNWKAGRVFHVVSHFVCKRTQAPTPKHAGPGENFLRDGMKLSEEAIAKLQKSHSFNGLNFAAIQTAATTTELLAQLAIRASL